MAQRQTIIIVYHDSQLRLMKTNEAAATEAARMNKKSSSAPSDNKTYRLSQRKVNQHRQILLRQMHIPTEDESHHMPMKGLLI